jgi:hypothetical protein
MAEINEVYGNDYKKKSSDDRVAHIVKLIAANIAHKEFAFRNESHEIWQGNNMRPEAIQQLVDQVITINKNMKLVYINKRGDGVNMFPYLVNGAVEYFVLIDLSKEKVKLYSLYITPTNVEPF